MSTSTLLRGAALAALLVPSVGLAQSPSTVQLPPAPAASPAAASPAVAQPASPAPSAATQPAVDQRIRTLQSQLGITEAQMPLWSAFHSYAQIARAYADNTERLATAFDSLYASLSETQRQAADTLFRQQATAAAQPRPRR
jgi:hypothetical protein